MPSDPTCAARYDPGREARPTVLIAEDSDDFREMLSAFLSGRGYEVVAARDGREAVAAALLHRPALVLMDIGLPGVDGLEAAREIRQTLAAGETHILVVSAYDSIEFRAEAIEAGCVGYMVKPVEPERLLEAVRLLVPAGKDGSGHTGGRRG